MKRQPAILAVLFAILMCPALSLAADSNIYDVLSRTLQPILSPFMQQPDPEARAWRMVCVVDAEDERRRVILSLEASDKLRIDTTHEGRRVSVARRGDIIWGSPADLLELWTKNIPRSSGTTSPGPFRLPVNDAAVVFLPALLQVNDLGMTTSSDKPARMADLQLAPELARKSGMESARIRVWIDPEHLVPLRAEVRGVNGWSGSILFEQVDFSSALPADTWQAEAESSTVTLSTADFLRILQQLKLSAVAR